MCAQAVSLLEAHAAINPERHKPDSTTELG